MILILLLLHIQFEPALQSVSGQGWRTLLYWWGGGAYETSCTSQHPQNDTIAISPELKECATRPQPVATPFQLGKAVKTENSILELSLLLTSKKYNHIYRSEKKRVKINARGVGQERFWGFVKCSTHNLREVKLGEHFNINTCTTHDGWRQLLSRGERGKGCLEE